MLSFCRIRSFPAGEDADGGIRQSPVQLYRQDARSDRGFKPLAADFSNAPVVTAGGFTFLSSDHDDGLDKVVVVDAFHEIRDFYNRDKAEGAVRKTVHISGEGT